MKFIALYGGSYNFPTKAHLDIGVKVREEIKPDAVWYQVSAQNPHKSVDGMAPFDDRVAMAKLNIEGEPKLSVSEAEKEICRRIGTTDSAAVLKAMIAHNPNKRFAWVVGADNFATLDTWHDYEYILGHMPLIVVPRRGWTEKAVNSVAALHPLTRHTNNPEDLRHTNAWYLLDFPENGHSATNERAELLAGRKPPMIRPNVYEYAMKNNLLQYWL